MNELTVVLLYLEQRQEMLDIKAELYRYQGKNDHVIMYQRDELGDVIKLIKRLQK